MRGCGTLEKMDVLLGSIACHLFGHKWHYTLSKYDGWRNCRRCLKNERLFKEFGKWFVLVRFYGENDEM